MYMLTLATVIMLLILALVGANLWPKMSEFLIKLGIENISPSQWLWSIGSGFGILIAWRYLSRVLKKRR